MSLRLYRSAATRRFLLGLAVAAYCLYVTIVLRGVYLSSYPGNRDVMLQIANSTTKNTAITFFPSYDFTAGMGNRLLMAPSWFNPISASQNIVGPSHAVWVGNAVFLMMALMAMLTLLRLIGLATETAVLSSTIFAIWLVLPSSLRIGRLSDFGGPGFSFSAVAILFGLGLAMWIRRDLKSLPKHVVLQLALMWMLTGTLLGQPLFVQSQLTLWLALALAFASLTKNDIKRISVWFSIVVTHLAVALFASALIAGSPIVAILASANSRPDSYRGLESDPASVWVLWHYLGSSNLVRIAVLAAVVTLAVFARRRVISGVPILLRLLLSCSVIVQVYALLWHFLLDEHGLEIGVRPYYLTEIAFVPILSIAAATALVLLADWVVERSRLLLRVHWPKVCGGLIAAALLPMLLLAAWTLKNPSTARVALDPSASPRLPVGLTKISALNDAVGARVLVIDPGTEVLDGVWLPDDYFQRIVNRESATKDEIRYVVHSHALTRWQHWLFEEFSATTGANGAIFLWARDFKIDFVQLLQPTHVLSPSQLVSPQLRLLSSDSANDGYLYAVMPLAEVPRGESRFHTLVVGSTDEATQLAVTNSWDLDFTVFAQEQLGPLVQAKHLKYQVTRDEMRVTASTSDASVVYLPIEYSRCHQLHIDSEDTTTARLLPLNGRFLGVYFEGSLEATITFRAHGPLGLMCQLQDYWETRNIG